MPAFRVVEHLDVIEHVLPGFLPAVVDFSSNAFVLEQLKKALRNSIVVTVTAPAHAGSQVMGLEEVLPVIAGELPWSE